MTMIDISNMEILTGEHEMAARLRSLGWDKTEQFTAYTVYLGKQRQGIGVTTFHPDRGPCECTHYALKLS